ncbi:MAG: phosphoheptose isomerase [archaeon]|nr:phosphoheptose isomerase [archaeon]
MKTICFDLDNVICSQTTGDYENAVPDRTAIKLVNSLHSQGHRIIIYTSRFMGRNNNDAKAAQAEGYQFTFQQLKGWGVKFHELFLGKPKYDVLVDDRAVFLKKTGKKSHLK